MEMFQELGVENVPGDLEEPLELGYYYSYCGINKWKDTGVRSEVTFCCQGGLSVDCETAAAQVEDQTGQDQGQAPGQTPGQAPGQSPDQAGRGSIKFPGKSSVVAAGPAGSTRDIVAAPSDSSAASGVIDNLKVRQENLPADQI